MITSRRRRWAGHVARMGERRGVYRVLVGKPEGRRPLGRPRRRWEDNIRIDLREVVCGCVDWMELAQVACACECGDEHSGSINARNFFTSCRPVSFSRRTLLHGVSNIFILILYMFRATLCSSSGGQLYEYNFWYNYSVLVALRYAGQDGTLHTGRPLTQTDYTRCCVYTIVLLRMSTELLETCRGFK